ncbi:MAG TPA: YCF48-related protein [Candidatus Limnocylindria bacterium]|nr:YCF48-related protein [Candidatus Limnocylindria bacterium]
MPPRDGDKAMDGLLRRSLARDAAAANVCPEPDILAAYAERSLEADEMARHEQHFSACARCREQLTAIFRVGSIAEVPVAHETPKVVAAAPRAIAVSPAATQPPETRSRHGKFDWRWMVPVAAAILVVVFIYGHNAFRSGKPLNSRVEVAMSRPEQLPAAGLTDNQLSAPQPAAPPPAPAEPRAKSAGKAQPPALTGKLPQVTRKSAPTPPTLDKEAARNSALRAQYEARDDFKKRADANISNNLEKSAPAEVDTYSAAKRDADLAPPPNPPSAAPAPGAATSTQIETKAGTRVVAPAQKSLVGGMANGRMQAQSAAGSNAAAKVSKTSQVVEVQSSGLIIQAPDAGVQYRVPAVGFVERSDDGGATWQGQEVKADTEILAGAAPSENVCWLVGRGGVVLMTSDGKNWKRVQSATKVDLVAVTASDATFATVTAADGRKYSTQNGGMTWQLLK